MESVRVGEVGQHDVGAGAAELVGADAAGGHPDATGTRIQGAAYIVDVVADHHRPRG